MEENIGNHNCECGKKFKHRSGLFKHSKKCEQYIGTIKFPPLPRKQCKEENCNYSYRYIEEFRNHLETVHKVNVVCETLLFKAYEDFLLWKEEYETKTVSSFTRNNAKKVDRNGGRSTEYYYCHRSGQYRCSSKGKRRLKSQGSLKINATCTAALKVTSLPNDHVRVFICHTHYGHKMDLCHIKISKRDKALLAEQLLKGIPKEKILHTLSPSNAATLERKNLIMRKDLHNISRAYGLKNIEKTKQYRLNVDDYFQEAIQQGTASVLLYKRRKEDELLAPEGMDSPFRSQDYAFAFMNQFQKESFQAFGNGIICLDWTTDCGVEVPQQELPLHDSLKIFSVTLIDDYSDGIPVAWLISNRDDSIILTLFFEQIKEVIGPLTPKAIICDKTSECYKCWVDVFEGEPTKLICSWHVYNEWRDKCSQLEDQDAASLCYQVLCMLLEEKDMAKFVILMQRCMKEMNENEALVEFGRYFSDEWAVIQEQWATCFRGSLGVETSTHMEPIHQMFKHLFLQEKFRKSPNKCLNLVLNFCSDLNMRRHEKHESERIRILDSHRLVSYMSLDVVKEVSPGTWYVSTDDGVYGNQDSSSGTVYSLVYIVKEVAESCTRVCNVKCAYCQICMHLYRCSCSESKTVTTICEHSHLVALSKHQNVQQTVEEILPEIDDGNIVLHTEPNARDFEMLDHNYFEAAPKETANPEKEASSTVGNYGKAGPTKTAITTVIAPGNTVGVPTVILPKDDPKVDIQLQLDRRLGVPILPKPQKIVIPVNKPPETLNVYGQSGTLLGIIIIPKSEPSVETIRNSILQDLEKMSSQVKACANSSALLALQGHINTAKSAFENAVSPGTDTAAATTTNNNNNKSPKVLNIVDATNKTK